MTSLNVLSLEPPKSYNEIDRTQIDYSNNISQPKNHKSEKSNSINPSIDSLLFKDHINRAYTADTFEITESALEIKEPDDTFISHLKEHNSYLKKQVIKNNILIDRANLNNALMRKHHYYGYEKDHLRSKTASSSITSKLRSKNGDFSKFGTDYTPNIQSKKSNIHKSVNRSRNYKQNKGLLINAIKKVTSPLNKGDAEKVSYADLQPNNLNSSISLFFKSQSKSAVSSKSLASNFSSNSKNDPKNSWMSSSSSLSGLIDKISKLETAQDSKIGVELSTAKTFNYKDRKIDVDAKLTPNTLKHVKNIRKKLG
ncbi:hypothetical protein AYI69_g5789 [Smittium culicis]|uniref:Uncharacterized protein n=1 Tax=Smittium culicis TaxID=133412 RepID=A0A1R1Y3B4_9FUNG|nr:hypothetical protein AYI69_g5789 [Smittium culicis]